MPITVFSPDLLVLQLHASDPRRKAHQSLFNGSLDLVRCQPVIFLGQSVSYSLEKAWHIAKPCTPDCKNHPMSAGCGDLGGQHAWVIVWFSLPFLPKFDPIPVSRILWDRIRIQLLFVPNSFFANYAKQASPFHLATSSLSISATGGLFAGVGGAGAAGVLRVGPSISNSSVRFDSETLSCLNFLNCLNSATWRTNPLMTLMWEGAALVWHSVCGR